MCSFSNEWDDRYKEKTHMSIYPWTDLVSYVMRYARPAHNNYKVLEVGCGAGANIPFFVNLGVDFYAVDGSQVIVEKLYERYPELKNKIVVDDFTKQISFDEKFDLIVDRGSITCNSTNDIKNTLSIINDKLKENGVFIGIDWFSTEHSEYRTGVTKVDDYTLTDFKEGPFSNTGTVHFCSKKHIAELLKDFRLDVLEHKITKKEIPESNYKFASWNFVAKKQMLDEGTNNL